MAGIYGGSQEAGEKKIEEVCQYVKEKHSNDLVGINTTAIRQWLENSECRASEVNKYLNSKPVEYIKKSIKKSRDGSNKYDNIDTWYNGYYIFYKPKGTTKEAIDEESKMEVYKIVSTITFPMSQNPLNEEAIKKLDNKDQLLLSRFEPSVLSRQIKNINSDAEFHIIPLSLYELFVFLTYLRDLNNALDKVLIRNINMWEKEETFSFQKFLSSKDWEEYRGYREDMHMFEAFRNYSEYRTTRDTFWNVNNVALEFFNKIGPNTVFLDDENVIGIVCRLYEEIKKNMIVLKQKTHDNLDIDEKFKVPSNWETVWNKGRHGNSFYHASADWPNVKKRFDTQLTKLVTEENNTRKYAGVMRVHSFIDASCQMNKYYQRGGIGTIIYPVAYCGFTDLVYVCYTDIEIDKIGIDKGHPVFVRPLPPLAFAIGSNCCHSSVSFKKKMPEDEKEKWEFYCNEKARSGENDFHYNRLNTVEYTKEPFDIPAYRWKTIIFNLTSPSGF
jgi:hypothetical protein